MRGRKRQQKKSLKRIVAKTYKNIIGEKAAVKVTRINNQRYEVEHTYNNDQFVTWEMFDMSCIQLNGRMFNSMRMQYPLGRSQSRFCYKCHCDICDINIGLYCEKCRVKNETE